MRNLNDKELERYADRIRNSLKDLTPLEKQKVFRKMETNPRREEDGLFDEINFDVDLENL